MGIIPSALYGIGMDGIANFMQMFWGKKEEKTKGGGVLRRRERRDSRSGSAYFGEIAERIESKICRMEKMEKKTPQIQKIMQYRRQNTSMHRAFFA